MARQTKRQVAFAICLGIKVDPSWSRSELSDQISKVTDAVDDEPVQKLQRMLAEFWEIDVDDAEDRDEAASELFDWWEEEQGLEFPSFAFTEQPSKSRWDQGKPVAQEVREHKEYLEANQLPDRVKASYPPEYEIGDKPKGCVNKGCAIVAIILFGIWLLGMFIQALKRIP